MSHTGSEYSPVLDQFKIKWSTLRDIPNNYRFEAYGDRKGVCNRCKYYRNNLLYTVFCKCNNDICSNRECIHLVKLVSCSLSFISYV